MKPDQRLQSLASYVWVAVFQQDQVRFTACVEGLAHSESGGGPGLGVDV